MKHVNFVDDSYYQTIKYGIDKVVKANEKEITINLKNKI
jgi:hypothetical protein